MAYVGREKLRRTVARNEEALARSYLVLHLDSRSDIHGARIRQSGVRTGHAATGSRDREDMNGLMRQEATETVNVERMCWARSIRIPETSTYAAGHRICALQGYPHTHTNIPAAQR